MRKISGSKTRCATTSCGAVRSRLWRFLHKSTGKEEETIYALCPKCTLYFKAFWKLVEYNLCTCTGVVLCKECMKNVRETICF